MSTDSNTHTLEVQDLSVELGRKRILDNIHLSFRSGSWVGILGPNGSGKTTLLRTLAGHLPYTGSATLNGTEIRSWNRKQLSFVLSFMRQHLSLQFDLSVEDFVLLGRLPHQRWFGQTTQKDTDVINTALDRLQLAALRTRPVRSLSGGEQQRVMLAQSLVQHAHILFLDEPTAHVDIHYQYAFLDQIKEQVAKGALVMSVFHDIDLAARYCHQLLVLNEGSVAGLGSPHQVLTESLIAEVFRMKCQVHRTDDHIDRILFIQPL